MKNVLKKSLVLVMVLSIFIQNFVTINAENNINDTFSFNIPINSINLQGYVNRQKLSNKEIQLLTDLGIDINKIEIMDPNSLGLNDNSRMIRESNLKESGVEKIHIVFKPINPIAPNEVLPGEGGGLHYYEEIESYSYPEEILNDKSKGMKFWLNVVYEVGSTKLPVWVTVPANVLKTAASNYLPTYYKGDSLRSVKHETFIHRHYMKYSPILGYEKKLVRTTKGISTIHMHLYTYDKDYNNIVRSDDEEKVFYTKHYFDYEWIKDLADSYLNVEYSVEHADEF